MRAALVVLAAIVGPFLGYAVYAFILWDANPGNYGTEHRASLVMVAMVFGGLSSVGVAAWVKGR